MESWNSFLQTVFQFVKSLFVNVSKKMHRNAVVLTTGVMVVTVVTFTAGDFHGGGRSALIAFAETPQATSEAEAELEETQAAGELETMPVIAEAENQETAEAESKETEASETETPGTETSETETEGEKAPETVTAETETAEAETEEAAAEAFACSSSDYRVLLKIVQAEAGICDTKGRILVANVILNRVKSKEFPDSIRGVVYEKYQFSPVIDGSIDTCKVTQKTIDAVDRALAGEDYSLGALYFMNRRTSSKKNVRWFDSRLEYLFKHGDHEFFK